MPTNFAVSNDPRASADLAPVMFPDPEAESETLPPLAFSDAATAPPPRALTMAVERAYWRELSAQERLLILRLLAAPMSTLDTYDLGPKRPVLLREFMCISALFTPKFASHVVWTLDPSVPTKVIPATVQRCLSLMYRVSTVTTKATSRFKTFGGGTNEYSCACIYPEAFARTLSTPVLSCSNGCQKSSQF